MSAQRYTAVAIVLHWAIAFVILFNIVLGFWMHISAEDGGVTQAVFQAFQLHKSVGLTVLALSLVRLAWRLTHKPPPLPEGMPGWERFAAKATHWAFYVLMIALPLSGWIYVSAGWSHEQERAFNVPTVWFGLVQVPHLFGIAEQSEAARAGVADGAFTAHYLLAYAAIALFVLHVGAALKHQFVNRDETLARMVPFVKAPNETEKPPRSTGRGLVLGVGLALVALFAASLLYAALTLGSGPTSAPAQPAVPIEAAQPVEAAPVAPAATVPGAPASWTVDRRASRIEFTGTHAGASFRGRFSRWSADIRFDPDNLEQSTAVVTVQTASAADGVEVHDASMPTAEWFDSANHPTAVFRTERMRARSDGSYEARGTLTIKGQAFDLRLPFTLTINADRAVMEGHASVDRREANLGMQSDPDAEWVSREIGIDVHVEATRAP